jgi:HEAT repeat protein
MALFRTGKPNVKALARRGDADALVAATGYRDLMPGADGGAIDRGAPIRREAILALGALGPELGTEAVQAALSDPSDGVRVAAIRVLYARRDAAPLAAALAWLPADHGHARPLAMRALAQLRRPEAAPALAAALVRSPGAVPLGEAEMALLDLLLEPDEGSDATGLVVEELLQALADERETVGDRAEQLLAHIAPASTEGLIAELKAGPAPRRAAAVLARIKDTRALEPLLEALRHRDGLVRAQSAAALGALRDPAAVEALIHATRDPEHRVRSEAGSALDRLGMVALVVGVSTLVRPMILEAIAAAETRPSLPAAEHDGSSGNGETPSLAPQPATTEMLERLLAGTDDVSDPQGRPS